MATGVPVTASLTLRTVCLYCDRDGEYDDDDIARCSGCRASRAAMLASVRREMDEARDKALDALSGYKFQMFGYWAAIWVHLNRLAGGRDPNPFKEIVHVARAVKAR